MASKQQRKTTKKNKAAAMENGNSACSASDATVALTGSQPQGGTDVLKLDDETAFTPEALHPENVAIYTASGKGQVIERIRHKWEEIRAVRERYPVSKGMLQRIAHETIQIALLPTTATRDKLIAAKLLITMAEGNRDKGLPEQEQNINVNISINDVLNAMGKTVDSEDCREYKPEIGGPDDYAD